MRARLGLVAAAAAALAGGWLWLRAGAAPPAATVLVASGDLAEELHEVGQVVARDPVVVPLPFDGKLQWIIDDATWVEAGAHLFTVGADDELKRAADDRAALGDAERELVLARLRREHGTASEGERLRAARAEVAIARMRHAIATGVPKGGGELARLDGELAAREAAVARLRADGAAAETAWSAAMDAWDAAADRLQELRGGAAGESARLREAEADLEDAKEGNGPATAAAAAEERRSAATAALERARTAVREAARAERAARARLDAAAVPRDAAAAAVAAAEEALRPLLVAVEVEKRGWQAERARLDERGAVLAAAEARRRLEQAEAAHGAGALSRLALDDQRAAAAEADAQLAIARRRREAAERPPTPEERAEADAALAAAEGRATRAQEAHDRALALLDRQGDLAAARAERLRAALAQRGDRFPEVVEAAIAAAEAELGEAEDGQRAALGARLAELRKDLDEARRAPPNEVRAPVAGLVRIRRDWGRPRAAGDQLWNGDAVVELHPPGNLAVSVRVNESAVARLRQGMPVRVAVPAAGVLRSGAIAHVSGVGRDKSQLQGRGGWSGVTQFEVRVALDAAGAAEDARLRQGMSARVDITVERVAGALWLPLAAVGGDGAVVLADGSRRVLRGRRFGDDAFLVQGGLAAGEAVRLPAAAAGAGGGR